MNGPEGRTVKIDLSFLKGARYRALVVRDKPDDPAAVDVETRDISRAQPLEIVTRPAGGLVVRFTPRDE